MNYYWLQRLDGSLSLMDSSGAIAQEGSNPAYVAYLDWAKTHETPTTPDSSSAPVVASPDGATWTIAVANDGTITTKAKQPKPHPGPAKAVQGF